MNDRNLRNALKTQLSAEHHDQADTFVIEEMAIPRGAARIDIAVINGQLHGYEIKSDLDTLERLVAQSGAYCGVFDRMTLVVGERHVREAVELVPDWWGIRVARWRSGSVVFRDLKLSIANPDPDPIALARLLWKVEALRFLNDTGGRSVFSSKSRRDIHQALAEKASVDDLRAHVRCCLKGRRLAVMLA